MPNEDDKVVRMRKEFYEGAEKLVERDPVTYPTIRNVIDKAMREFLEHHG